MEIRDNHVERLSSLDGTLLSTYGIVFTQGMIDIVIAIDNTRFRALIEMHISMYNNGYFLIN